MQITRETNTYDKQTKEIYVFFFQKSLTPLITHERELSFVARYVEVNHIETHDFREHGPSEISMTACSNHPDLALGNKSIQNHVVPCLYFF